MAPANSVHYIDIESRNLQHCFKIQEEWILFKMQEDRMFMWHFDLRDSRQHSTNPQSVHIKWLSLGMFTEIQARFSISSAGTP
jgi:hypothetical protein